MRAYTTAVLVAALCLVFAGVAQANVIAWTDGVGNWNVNTNWDGNGIPAAPNNIAVIGHGGTVTVSDSQSCTQLMVGDDGNGPSPGSGILTIVDGGSLNVTQGAIIGNYNVGGNVDGQVKQYGGTLTVAGWFDLSGRSGGAGGYYNLYGGLLDINTDANIGRYASSTFGVIGGLGTMDVLNNFKIWGNGTLVDAFQDATGVSTITVHGTATLADARLRLFVDEATTKYHAGDSWTILNAAGGLSGEFLSAANGDTITSTGGLHSFRINYNANSAWLTALDSVNVPEPGTLVLLGSGLLGLLAYAWRRRK